MKSFLLAILAGLNVIALIINVGMVAYNDTPPEKSTPSQVTGTPEDMAAFHLTPPHPGETVLERWKRTKADYERAAKLQEKVCQSRDSPPMLAIGPYSAATKELETAECGKVCK